MRFNKTLAVFTFVCCSASAHAQVALDVIATPIQLSQMQQGVEYIDNYHETSTVRMVDSNEPVKKRGTLVVIAFNNDSKPVNIGSDNIAIRTKDGILIPVIPYSKLVKEEQGRQRWRGIAAGLAAGFNSTAASNAGHSEGSFSALGSHGGYVSGTYSSYNAGIAYLAQSQANADNREMFDRMKQNNAAAMRSLTVNLQTTTIRPGTVFGGQVIYEIPKNLRKSKKPIPVEILVKVGEQLHRFDAAITPAK